MFFLKKALFESVENEKNVSASVDDSPESGDLKHGDFSNGKNREVEIKFGVLGRPENLMKLFESAGGTVSNPQTDVLENTYFDTPEQTLFKMGAGLRIRHGNKL